MTKEVVNCGNCSAACCEKDQQISLTDAEAAFLRAGGTSLNQKGVPEKWRRFSYKSPTGIEEICGIYQLSQRCGYVVEKDGWLQCDMYEDIRRPEDCGLFPTGGKGCVIVRKLYMKKTPSLLTRIFSRPAGKIA